MTPEEICRILNENKHDGQTDWALAPNRLCYFSRRQRRNEDIPFTPLSPASAEIIAQHYKRLEASL